jgi:hypothetical protein
VEIEMNLALMSDERMEGWHGGKKEGALTPRPPLVTPPRAPLSLGRARSRGHDSTDTTPHPTHPLPPFQVGMDGLHLVSSDTGRPLRASPLKNEIVSLVSEINSYLISFFRGQLIVSLIDGLLIAIALLFMGLDFAILIGLMVGVLGLIPYLGMMICYIPAVIIAAAQFGDWTHPLIVTAIFILANNIDGIFIAPKIVGESVGLHPLTVIVSVLAWSLILGGLLGALLAVPLTATIKVLLKRYFWDRPSSSLLQSEPPI